MVWVTLEGVNGAGKTYLAGRLAARLGDRAAPVAELTDAGTHELRGRVIAAMAAGGDFFLRSGTPIAETFALAGLKVREYEAMKRAPGGPAVVVEDRGLDTVVAYQAAILAGPGATDDELAAWADKVAAIAARWRPPPELTLLVTDDLDRCLARVERREGRPLSAEERSLVARVDRLYRRLAAREPHRVVVIDRAGRGTDAVTEEMAGHCLARLGAGAER